MINLLLAFITVFVVTICIMPIVIVLMKKLKIRQTVLHYVKEHEGKSGTPTIGGVGFILPLLLSLIFFNKDKSLAILTLSVTIGYGIVGFLDDFIKVYFKRNDGLTPIQKILFQLIIAFIIAISAYYNQLVGSSVYLFFSNKQIDLGILSIPLYIFMFLLLTNSVNLTDGLDGLVSSVTIIYLIFFAIIIFLGLNIGQAYDELNNLIVFCVCLIASLLGFLCFNGFPARIFMGDTGSLALGGALACLSIFSKRILTVPFLGIMYMLSSISVIIQVAYFKATKGKRVFLMSPLHHHYQKRGIHESKITLLYSIITAISGVFILILMLVLNR